MQNRLKRRRWCIYFAIKLGYEEKSGKLTLYFHGASEGKKIDLIKQQNTASFEMDTKHQLVEADVACSYSYLYQSIMGKGKISLVGDSEEKNKGFRMCYVTL